MRKLTLGVGIEHQRASPPRGLPQLQPDLASRRPERAPVLCSSATYAGCALHAVVPTLLNYHYPSIAAIDLAGASCGQHQYNVSSGHFELQHWLDHNPDNNMGLDRSDTPHFPVTTSNRSLSLRDGHVCGALEGRGATKRTSQLSMNG